MRPGVLGNRPRAKRRLGLSRPSSSPARREPSSGPAPNPASLQLRRHAAQREPLSAKLPGYVARCFLLRVPTTAMARTATMAPPTEHCASSLPPFGQSIFAKPMDALSSLIVMTRDKWASSGLRLARLLARAGATRLGDGMNSPAAG